MAKKKDQVAVPAQWPASTVRMWKLADIKPYPQNARNHPPEQIKRLAKNMIEYGVTAPILVDEAGVILYGHGRRLAAIENGFEEYPVCQATGWSDEKKRKARIEDNKRGLESLWDDTLLSIELKALQDAGVSIAQMGFTTAEIAKLMERTPGHTDPDETPPPAEKPFVQAGDLWELGRHRIICGDSTDAETVKRLFGKDANPMLCVTDPPYGVEYDAAWRPNVKSPKAGAGGKFSSGKHAEGKVENDGRADWREAWALFPGDVIYAWHAGKYAAIVSQSLSATGFGIAYQIIWAKPVHVIGRGDYHYQHEPCWYAVREGKNHRWNGSRKETTLWQIQNMHRTQGSVDDGKTNHSTQKPVECMKRPIENNSKHGEWVYDPFSGSGTTIIAAEQTGRRCVAVELSPVYVQMAIERWQRFTKEVATLNGVPFDQVKKERGGRNAKGSDRKPVSGRNAGTGVAKQKLRPVSGKGRAAAG